MDKKVEGSIAKAAVVRGLPEISVGFREGGWAVYIDNQQAGHLLASKAGAKTVAGWLEDLFEEHGRPLVVGGFSESPVC